MSVTRREFLQAVAVSAAGAVAFTGCTAPGSTHEFRIESPPRLPEDLVAGEDNWYASVCQECGAGCGVIVRVIDGRAQKLEGNPDYPVNQGRLSAPGQAGVQALYHPDRIAGPLRRSGDRGSGQLQSISWEEGLTELTSRVRALSGQAGSILMVTGRLRGHQALVIDRFVKSLGAQHAVFEPLDSRANLREAVRRVFGLDQLPAFDVAGASYVLSFGADFLGTWLSPVQFGKAFGVFRQGRPGMRGRLVQVEPRMSQTGAVADEWVPVNPGTEGILALSVAQALAASGRADQAGLAALTGNAGPAALAAYDPRQTSHVTGVPAETVAAIARDLADLRPALVLGGDSAGAHTNGLFNLTAIYSLNLLLGSVGGAGVKPNPPSPFADLPAPTRTTLADWQRLAEDMRAGRINLLLVYGANPAHGLPAALKLRDALAKVPYVVSFSGFPDETTALADLVLPDSHYLESWGDDVPEPGPGYQTVGFQQPVVVPQLNTRSFADLLLVVASELGGPVRAALPWDSYKQVLQEAAGQLQKLGRGSVPAGSADAYWIGLLQHGGWWDTGPAGVASPPAPRPVTLPAQPVQPKFDGADREYYLHVYPSPVLREGQGASLPWLQGLPDPMTTGVWTTWLEVSPKTAADLGVAEGDIVAVESSVGSAEVPVYVYPAIPPSVVAMPLGQGHTAYGRYAEGRGANPLDVVAPQTDAETGALAWAATKVRVRKTGRRLTRFPKFEGAVQPFIPETVPMLQKKGEA